MSGMEIERKFLVRNDIDFRTRARRKYAVKQGYILAKTASVRVRLRDEKAFLTIKSKIVEGFSRYEFEMEISTDEARELLKLCERPLIEKTRYLVDVGNHTFEVDEFAGENEGLVVAEVELGSEDEAFDKPDFIGLEVTGDVRFYNSRLRKVPFSQWSDTIEPIYRKK